MIASLFSLQTVKEANRAEIDNLQRRAALYSELTGLMGSYVIVTLCNGSSKKGYIQSITARDVALDTTKPKRVGGLWVRTEHELRRINHDTVLFEAIATIEPVLKREELTYYCF